MSRRRSLRRRRSLWRAARRVLTGLLVVLLAAFLFLRLFIFPQGRYHHPTISVSLTTEDGVSLSALLLGQESEILVIVVHGFAASNRTPEIIRLAEDLAVEFDVLTLDLRGHGESGGVYSFDLDSAALDLRAAVTWGQEQGYRRIGVVGFSLGAAGAVLEQARQSGVDSIVVVSCPATSQMGGTTEPWAWSKPGRLLLQLVGTKVTSPSGIDTWPAEVVQRIAPVPLLVVHGDKDDRVPEEVSRALYDSAREPKEYLILPDEGHAQLGDGRSEVQAWFRDSLLLEDLAPLPWAHVIERRLAQEPTAALPAERGILVGQVYGHAGEPLAGALVLLATETGHTFTAFSDAQGHFRLEAPVGRFVPIATAPGYESALFRHGADQRTPVEVTAGEEHGGIEFTLLPHTAVRPDPVDISLSLSPAEQTTAPNPQPVTAQRRQVIFEYDGRQEEACFLYEPITAPGPLPVILAIYPSEALRWNIVSVPMAAEGYVVLACGPPYIENLGQLDLPGYARGLGVIWALLEAGRLSSQADPSRYGILTGSISSFILALALPDLPPPQVIVGIGGGYDLFLVLQDLYERPDYALDERFVMGLAALGRPDMYPETFLAVSVRFHAASLPPIGLFHSALDEVLLVDQAEEMAATLEELGRPFELHRYEELAHYPGVEDPPPETIQMYGEIMELFERYLR